MFTTAEPEPNPKWYRVLLFALALLGIAAALYGFVMRQTARDPCSAGCASAADTQAELRQADAAAKEYLVGQGSFKGFSVDAAAQIDPSIDWIRSDTAVGKVAIRGVTPSHVLLVSADVTGQGYCVLEDRTAGTSYARTDAQQADECKGDSW